MRSSPIFRGTFTLDVSILLPTTCGAIVSLSPPTGEPTLAQENKMRLRIKRKTIFFIEKF